MNCSHIILSESHLTANIDSISIERISISVQNCLRARQRRAGRIAVRIVSGTGTVSRRRMRKFVDRGGGLILGVASGCQERQLGVIDWAVGDEILGRESWRG